MRFEIELLNKIIERFEIEKFSSSSNTSLRNINSCALYKIIFEGLCGYI